VTLVVRNVREHQLLVQLVLQENIFQVQHVLHAHLLVTHAQVQRQLVLRVLTDIIYLDLHVLHVMQLVKLVQLLELQNVQLVILEDI
jgi:hypothetical protein